MVLHDLNLAARYADHLVAMKAGRVVAAGRPREVLTPELLAEVFGLQALVLPDPVTDGVLVVPVGARRRVARQSVGGGSRTGTPEGASS
jgi:iron complex transport system ATP-binding protein